MVRQSFALARREVQIEPFRRPALMAWWMTVYMAFSSLLTGSINRWDNVGKELFSIRTSMLIAIMTLLISLLPTGMTLHERYRGVWPLLLATGMSSLEFVSARAALALTLLGLAWFVQLPFICLITTLGEVSWHQVLATDAAVLSSVAAAGGIGLLCASCFHRMVPAAILTLLLVALKLSAPYLLQGVALCITDPALTATLDGLASQLFPFNMPHQLFAISVSPANASVITPQVLGDMSIAAGSFLVSWPLFASCHIYPTEPGSFWKAPATERLSPPRRAWMEAIAWKQFEFSGRGRRGAVARILIYGIISILLLGFFSEWGRRSFDLRDVGIAFFLFLPLEMAFMAPRLWGWEVADKALDTLILVPFTTRELCRAKTHGAILSLSPAIAYTLLGLLLCLPAEQRLGSSPLPSWDVMALILSAIVVGLLLLWISAIYFSLNLHPWFALLLSLIMVGEGYPGLFLVKDLMNRHFQLRMTPAQFRAADWFVCGLTGMGLVILHRLLPGTIEQRAANLDQAPVKKNFWLRLAERCRNRFRSLTSWQQPSEPIWTDSNH